ncbi:hypothetical protein [Terrabacter terrigena]|uniref:Uncharacterized protein n=1 Tax=Terrabacter terrigena TaxID=574718 RepID=A0ABW3MXI2_9MICO
MTNVFAKHRLHHNLRTHRICTSTQIAHDGGRAGWSGGRSNRVRSTADG